MVSDIAQAGDAATCTWNVSPAFSRATGAFQSTFPSSPCTTGPEKARQADGCRHGRRTHSRWDQLCPLYAKLEAVTIAECQCPDNWVTCTRYDAREYADRRADDGDAKHADYIQVTDSKTFAFRNERGAILAVIAGDPAADPASTANTNSTAVTYGYGDRAYQHAYE